MKKIQLYIAITDISKAKEQKLVESKWIENTYQVRIVFLCN